MKNKIISLCEGFTEEPEYAICSVRFYKENNSDVTHGMLIKLNIEFDLEDYTIFYYCKDTNHLLSLTEKGAEDFIITNIEDIYQKDSYLNC